MKDKTLKLLGKLTRWLWFSMAAVVIGYGVIVVLGRTLLPYLDDYRPQVAKQLSEVLGAQVQLQRLSGTWPRLVPTLTANGVQIKSNGEGHITIGQLSAELEPLASIWRGQLIWRKLSLSQVELQLVEDASGQWSLAGFPLAGGGSGMRPLEILLYSSLIQVDRVSVALQFFSGAKAVLNADNILVENSDEFHRIVAAISTGAKPGSDKSQARFVFEAEGDYRDLDEFQAQAFVELQQLDLSAFGGFFARLLPAYEDKIAALDGSVATQLWLQWGEHGRVEMRGQLQTDQLPLDRAMALPEVRELNTDITGWYHPGEDWGLALQGLQFHWGEENILPLDIRFSQKVGERWGEFGLDINYLSVDALRQLVLGSELLPQKASEVVTAMAPSGHLDNVSLDAVLADGSSPQLMFKANLRDVGIRAYRHAPAASGVDGYVETSLYDGILALDSRDSSLHFDKLFTSSIDVNQVTGTLGWNWDRQRSQLSLVSSPLQADAPAGQLNGQFYLHLPIKRPEEAPQLFLQLGVVDSHSRFRDQFVPKILSPGLISWLDSALDNVSVSEAGVIFRGSVRKGQGDRRTFLLHLAANGERLKYHPEWPALEDFSGRILYHGNQLQGQVDSGRMGDMAVSNGRLTMDVGDDLRLNIRAAGSANATQVYDLLSSSPLKPRVDGLANWQLAGDINTTVDLEVPLKESWTTGRYKVVADVVGGELLQPEYQLKIDDVAGRVHFDLNKGLYGDNLKGRVWGMDATAALTTDNGRLQLTVDGALQPQMLAQHFGIGLEQQVSGESRYQAVVVLPGQGDKVPGTVLVKSELQGIAIELPEPFGKSAEQKVPLDGTLQLAERPLVTATYGHSVRLGAEWRGQSIGRGYLGINRSDLTVPEEEILLLGADVSDVNLVDWQSSLFSMFDSQRSSEESLQATSGLLPPVSIDVRVGKLGVSALKLDNVHLAGSLVNSVLHTKLTSQEASGLLNIPLDNRKAMVIDLEYLQLPDWQKGGDGAASEFDPRTLRSMKVSVDKLITGERELGSIAFALDASDHGLDIKQINGNLLGADIRGDFYWNYDGQQHSSRYTGTISSGTISQVLENLGMEPIIKGDEAVFQNELSWAGRPWEFDRNNLSGQMTFSLEDGSIQQAKGSANPFVRVVGLLNFSTWLRRLRLDFSDVFSKGLSYDHIGGSLIFDQGRLRFPEPIVANAPSGTMKMYGNIDLINEQIDAQLVATLPVGTNLPWVAGVVVSLPAAAGAWVISKIFKKQVNTLSSLSYKIEGSWDDPDFEIEKVFTDKQKVFEEPQDKTQTQSPVQSSGKKTVE